MQATGIITGISRLQTFPGDFLCYQDNGLRGTKHNLALLLRNDIIQNLIDKVLKKQVYCVQKIMRGGVIYGWNDVGKRSGRALEDNGTEGFDSLQKRENSRSKKTGQSLDDPG